MINCLIKAKLSSPVTCVIPRSGSYVGGGFGLKFRIDGYAFYHLLRIIPIYTKKSNKVFKFYGI